MDTVDETHKSQGQELVKKHVGSEMWCRGWIGVTLDGSPNVWDVHPVLVLVVRSRIRVAWTTEGQTRNYSMDSTTGSGSNATRISQFYQNRWVE